MTRKKNQQSYPRVTPDFTSSQFPITWNLFSLARIGWKWCVRPITGEYLESERSTISQSINFGWLACLARARAFNRLMCYSVANVCIKRPLKTIYSLFYRFLANFSVRRVFSCISLPLSLRFPLPLLLLLLHSVLWLFLFFRFYWWCRNNQCGGV